MTKKKKENEKRTFLRLNSHFGFLATFAVGVALATTYVQANNETIPHNYNPPSHHQTQEGMPSWKQYTEDRSFRSAGEKFIDDLLEKNGVDLNSNNPYNLSKQDLDIIFRYAATESGVNDPVECIEGIFDTFLNRLKSHYHPETTVRDIVTAPGQYSAGFLATDAFRYGPDDNKFALSSLADSYAFLGMTDKHVELTAEAGFNKLIEEIPRMDRTGQATYTGTNGRDGTEYVNQIEVQGESGIILEYSTDLCATGFFRYSKEFYPLDYP